jgi:hypothetical protein
MEESDATSCRTCFFISLIAAVGTIGIAPIAHAIPSCVNAGDVTALWSAGCNLGGLNFTDFAVSPVGMVAKIYLGAFSAVVGNNVNLSFQVAHSPSPATLADMLFTYTVNTLSGLPELGGVDLYNAGLNVTIKETVCATKLVGGVCPSGALADYFVEGGKERAGDLLATAVHDLHQQGHPVWSRRLHQRVHEQPRRAAGPVPGAGHAPAPGRKPRRGRPRRPSPRGPEAGDAA